MKRKIILSVHVFILFFCISYNPIMAQTKLILSLTDAIEISLEKNRALTIAQRKVEEQQAGIGEARSLFLPQMSGDATYTKLDVAPYISLGKKSPFPMPAGSPTKITIGDDNLYDLGVNLQQPIFTGFALRNSYVIAKESLDAAENEHETVEMDIILKTKEMYYNLLKVRKLLDISNESVALMEAHVSDLEKMLKVGIISENDLLKAQVQLSETKLAKIRMENITRLTQKSFCIVLGIPISTEIELKTPLEYTEKQVDLDMVINTALENRSEVQSLKNTISIAKKGVSLAKSQKYPQLMAVYNFNYKRPNREYEKEFYSVWTAGLVAHLNIFDWGGIHYKVEQAELRHRQVEESMKQLSDAIILEANQAYFNLEEASQRIDVVKINVAQAEENFRVTRKKFSQGLVTNTELLDASTALTRARVEQTSALSDYLVELARLERVTGKVNE